MNRYVSIQLDRDLEKPLYIQIYEGILNLIKQNKLEPGEKLPAIRKLSSFLNVNTVTIVSAYKLLEEHGYVVSKVGSGTYVNPSIIERKALSEAKKDDVTLETSHSEVSEKTYYENDNRGLKKIRYDFAGAAISPEFFPVKDFKDVLNEVLERDRGYAFDYHQSMGYYPLREALGCFMQKEYKINMSPDEIHVVSGAQQGIDIISKAFLHIEDRVFVESPTYTGAIDAFKSRGAKIVEIPMEEDGINLDIFLTKLKNKPPKLFYTMPNFQNPTGYSYSREKKKELLDLSLKYNFLIIEDDHMNDLYYEEKPVPLKTLDNADRVLYIKSFSKLFMPGLRLAFILSPREYAKKIADVKYFTDISSSGLTQRAMDLFLRKTLWPKHVKNIRSIFLKKRNAIKESFKIMPSEVNYTIPNGGLFFWVSLPEGFYSMNLYNEALKHDILIMPGDIFFPEKRPSTGFRMSFAEIAPDDINDGVELLSKIIDEFLDKYRISPIRGTGYRPLI